MKTKTCNKCGKRKKLSQFYASTRGRLGRSSECKSCRRSREKTDYAANHDKRRKYQQAYYYANHDKMLARCEAYRKANRDEVRARNKAWYYANRDQVLAQDKHRRKVNPEQFRGYDLRKKYGLTLTQFRELAKAQNHKCAICLKRKKLCVDHCHDTGRVRMLLCSDCNLGIGRLNDSPTLLLRAAKLLRNPPARKIFRKSA